MRDGFVWRIFNNQGNVVTPFKQTFPLDARLCSTTKPSTAWGFAPAGKGNKDDLVATLASNSVPRTFLLGYSSVLGILRRFRSSSRVFLWLQPRLQRYITLSPARAALFEAFPELSEAMLLFALARFCPSIGGGRHRFKKNSYESQQRCCLVRSFSLV